MLIIDADDDQYLSIRNLLQIVEKKKFYLHGAITF